MLQESQVAIVEHLNILQAALSRRLVHFGFYDNLMLIILLFPSCININSMGPTANGVVSLLYLIHWLGTMLY